MKHLNDNKKFWKKNETFFSDKEMKSNKMMIIKKDLSEERCIAEVMNNYFVDIFKSLNLKESY